MIRSFAQAAVQQQIKDASARHTQQRAEQRLAGVRADQARRAQRNSEGREATPAAVETRPSARQTARSETRRPSREDNDLFSALLEDSDDIMTPLLAFSDSQADQQGFGELEETASSAAPPAMSLWQEIEPALSTALHEVQPGEMMLTFMLPKLGNVDAQMAALPGGGWDIALHLQPAAWQALLPHQERCRLSLRQRMNSRVRLRFERRSQDDREQEA